MYYLLLISKLVLLGALLGYMSIPSSTCTPSKKQRGNPTICVRPCTTGDC